jgi:hypothetical protein
MAGVGARERRWSGRREGIRGLRLDPGSPRHPKVTPGPSLSCRAIPGQGDTGTGWTPPRAPLSVKGPGPKGRVSSLPGLGEAQMLGREVVAPVVPRGPPPRPAGSAQPWTLWIAPVPVDAPALRSPAPAWAGRHTRKGGRRPLIPAPPPWHLTCDTWHDRWRSPRSCFCVWELFYYQSSSFMTGCWILCFGTDFRWCDTGDCLKPWFSHIRNICSEKKHRLPVEAVKCPILSEIGTVWDSGRNGTACFPSNHQRPPQWQDCLHPWQHGPVFLVPPCMFAEGAKSPSRDRLSRFVLVFLDWLLDSSHLMIVSCVIRTHLYLEIQISWSYR